MFLEAQFAFNDEGANHGFWRFQLRGNNGRWIKMYGLCSFEYTDPVTKKVMRVFGTFQGNRSRGWSMIRVGEGESLAPGDYEIDSRYIRGEKALIRTAQEIKEDKAAPKKIDEAVGQEADARQVVAATVGDLEVGDIVQQSTEAGLYGRIASVDHSGNTTKLNVEWSDGTAFDMDLPKDQKIKVWNSQNADVPTTNGGLDWANNDDWYQQALDEYDENRAAMNGDSNAPTDFVPGDNLLEVFEGYNFDPYKGFDTEKTKSKIVDFKNRKVVLVDMNGVKVPFYLSTGHGGKKDVASRKWYPFFGVERSTEWLNKGNGKYINDYYGSPELRAQAEWLDANIGDIMDDTSYPYVRSSAKDDSNVDDFTDIVNADTHPIRLDTEGLGNDKMDTLIKANIADIVNRVRMEPGALQKKADEAKARVDAVKKQIEVVDAPKSEVKDPNLKPEMDGEDALATIRNAAAEVALEDGRFPVARSAEDIEAGAKKQYAGVFDSLKEEYPQLVGEFKDFEDFWTYAKKNLAAGTTTRYADSVNDIPPLMKAANRIYARDVLGVDPDGLITFYRNSINGHADVAKAAAGYASLDRNMAFNYNSNKGNDGANGRYAIKAKPGQVWGLLGYSDAADEHGVVIGPDVTAMPGRVERLGDLAWTPVNELMDPKLTQSGTSGGSMFRHFSTASTFEFPVLDANPFAQGETDKWSDFYAANGLEKGAIPSKYDEIYGEGAFERDFPGSSGVPRYDIARGLFTEKGGQFALDPIKFDGNFPAEGGSMVGKAGDKRDKALKFFEAVQQLSGQRFMNLRGEEKSEPVMVDETKRKTGLFNEYSPERLDQTAESTPLTDLGFEPWEEIVVYRGIPGGAEDAINPGDWVTANEQLARDYAGGGGKVVKMLVKARDLLGDKSSGEGAYTEEMIYRPSEKEVESGGGFVLSPDSDEQSSEAPVTHTFDGKTYTFSPEEIENASHYISRGASGSLDVTDEEGKEFNERMRALTDYLRPGKVSDETIAGQEKLLGYKPGTKIKVGELRHSAPPARFDEIMKNGIRPKITDKVGTERYSQRRFGVFMANDYTSAEAGELADVFRIKVPENELRVDSGYTPYGQNLYIERTIDPSEIEYLGHIPAGTSDESNDFALHDGRGAECTICNPELKEKSPAKSETRKKPGAGGIIGRDKLGNPIYDNNK